MGLKNNKSHWVILVIVFLGLILRIYNLDAESLWYDEIGSIDQATRSLPELFFGFHLSPLYFLFLRYWIRLFSFSEFWLRFPSVIFGVICIFLIYQVAKELFNKKVGLISAFILAINPFHLFYSQEVRHYSLFTLFTLFSMLMFIKIIKGDNKFNIYILYIIVTILLLYTNIFGLLIILIQNLFIFLLKEFKLYSKKQWFISQFVILSIFLFWYIPFIMFLQKEDNYVAHCIKWIPRPNFYILIDTFKTFSYGGNRYGGMDFFINPKEIGLAQNLLYIFLSLFIIGIFFLQYKNFKYRFLILLWLFIPILFLIIFSFIFIPIFVIRYIIFASPAFYIGIAKGIDRISNSRIYNQIIILSVITILTSQMLFIYYTKKLKMDWKSAIAYLESKIEENDVVVVSPSHCVQMFGYYGNKGIKFQDKKTAKINLIKSLGIDMYKGNFIYPFGKYKLIGIQELNYKFIKDLINGYKKSKHIWFILATRWIINSEEFKKHLIAFFSFKDKKDFEGITIYYCED